MKGSRRSAPLPLGTDLQDGVKPSGFGAGRGSHLCKVDAFVGAGSPEQMIEQIPVGVRCTNPSGFHDVPDFPVDQLPSPIAGSGALLPGVPGNKGDVNLQGLDVGGHAGRLIAANLEGWDYLMHGMIRGTFPRPLPKGL